MKKDHTVRNVIIGVVLGILVVLGAVVGTFAIITHCLRKEPIYVNLPPMESPISEDGDSIR